MLEVLQFIFSNFWIFWGTVLLLSIICETIVSVCQVICAAILGDNND